MNFKKIATTLVATLALGAAAAPAASAAEQRAMTPEERYAYSCGHLGTDCSAQSESRSARKRSRRSCSASKQRAAKRAGRNAERRYARRCSGRKTRGARGRR